MASVLVSAATLKPWFYEWRNRAPSGRQAWFQGSGMLQRMPDGSVVWNRLIVDITARKQVEATQACAA